VADRTDARRTMHSEADVPLPADGRLPGVQTHPHSHLVAVRPFVGGKSSLCVYCGSERGVCRRECEEEGLALVVDLPAALLFDRLPQDLLMLGEDGSVPLAQLLQEPGRALHVREQERDRPRRQLNQLSSLRRVERILCLSRAHEVVGSHFGEIGRRVLPDSSCAH
jgi:hypothetical protein